MALKMILIINSIYVKSYKPIFQDSEKPKLHLNNMWLYPGILMTCLSRHRRKEGNFSAFLEQDTGAQKPWAKAEPCTRPQWQPYLVQEVTCVLSDAGSFTCNPLQLKHKFILVVLSWLKMLDRECFHLAFYGSYKSVCTVHKIMTFLKTFWGKNARKSETAKTNRIMPHSLVDSHRPPLLGRCTRVRSLAETSVWPQLPWGPTFQQR